MIRGRKSPEKSGTGGLPGANCDSIRKPFTAMSSLGADPSVGGGYAAANSGTYFKAFLRHYFGEEDTPYDQGGLAPHQPVAGVQSLQHALPGLGLGRNRRSSTPSWSRPRSVPAPVRVSRPFFLSSSGITGMIS